MFCPSIPCNRIRVDSSIHIPWPLWMFKYFRSLSTLALTIPPRCSHVFKIYYTLRFASLLYDTFMKQNCWHKIEVHICTIEHYIQDHEPRVSIFNAKNLKDFFVKINMLLVCLCNMYMFPSYDDLCLLLRVWKSMILCV